MTQASEHRADGGVIVPLYVTQATAESLQRLLQANLKVDLSIDAIKDMYGLIVAKAMV